MTTYIKRFTDLNKSNADIAGGKGASLGEMTQVGIPVPNGFVVLSGAFEQFLAETDLVQEVDAILDKVNHKEIHTVEHASEEIKALILQAEMPKDITSDIQKHLKRLGAKFVAVRSSATAEDSSSAAWAGQLESYLNTTETDLLDKVKQCWASLFTPRAIFYRFEKGLHTTKISVAVVIQKMVESEVSGIAFSVHPVTEDPNQLIIEAGFGLGEAIVSGSITPDSYVVEKNPRRIIDKNISAQERGLYRNIKLNNFNQNSSILKKVRWDAESNNLWVDIEKGKGAIQKLSDDQIFELSELILRIENHYSFPCDIEWAYERGKFFIVQSRPITTLKLVEKKLDISDYAKGMVLFTSRPNSIQRGCLFCLNFQKNPYQSIQKVVSIPISNTDDEWYFSKGDFDALATNEAKEFFSENFLEEYISRAKRYFDDMYAVCKQVNRAFTSESAYTGRAAAVKEYFAYPGRADSYFYFGLAVWSFDQKVVPVYKERLQTVLKSEFDRAWEIITSQTVITEEQQMRVELAELKRASGGAVNSKKLQEFQTKYGHLGIYAPEDRGFTTEVFQKMFAEINVDETFKIPNQIKINKRIFNEFRERIQDKHILQIIDQINYNVYFRTVRSEKISIGLGLVSPMYEYLIEHLGYTRKEVGNLTNKEVIEYFESGSIPPRRSSRPAMYFKNGDPVLLDEVQKKIFLAEFETKDKLEKISGSTAYKGVVTGKARIITSVDDLGKVQTGDILVSQFTRPEYLSAMHRAAAFVTNDGGITCHAAIVARELKKPCIIGTKVATKVLKDGDMVEVDANRGIVKIIK